ncbi:thioredoxin-disulfide reductase [Candidatus Dependentiae bacterium]|nr:MAG: thioredoxin-disulfide reductase [Candidatus Dependentiae bacterium]
MKKNTKKLIIVGSGPAGLTAGIYAARANLEPLIIEGNKPGGQLMGTSYVENWPGNERILGPELMTNMRTHAKKMGCVFAAESITKVDFSKHPLTLWTNKNNEYSCDACIIATGASHKKLNVPGEKEYWGKGITVCAICDAAFYKDKEVIVVGGGDTAMEDASFLTKFTTKITIIQLIDKLTASKPMQKRVLENPDIKIIYNSTVTVIHGDKSHITDITIVNQKTKEQQKLKADGLFLAIGLKPNSDPFKDQLDLDKWGYIKLTNHTATSARGVFAAGDVADPQYHQAITSAGSGCMAALDAERYLVTTNK